MLRVGGWLILLWLMLSTNALPSQTAATGSAPFSGTHAAKSQPPAAGTITNGVYRNPSAGFSYKIPYGWVVRTDRMREDSDDPAKERVLLAVFERPPEATGTTINSAVVIAAESASSYPGLKTAAEYFGPLEQVTAAKGLKVVEEPYQSYVGAKLLGREDFGKEIGPLTMRQATLVLLQKGYILSFTFIGESEDEVNGLIEGLRFGVPAKASATHPSKSTK